MSDSQSIVDRYLNELDTFCENGSTQTDLQSQLAAPNVRSSLKEVGTNVVPKSETQKESKVSYRVYQSRSGYSIPLITLHNVNVRKNSAQLKWIPHTQRKRAWTKEEETIFQEAYTKLLTREKSPNSDAVFQELGNSIPGLTLDQITLKLKKRKRNNS